MISTRGPMRSETIGEVTSLSGIPALLIGLWLGAGIAADLAVTQNFQTVDRFLVAPGTPATAAEIAALGKDRTRALLRRNAGEENNWIFTNWETVELALGAAFLLSVVTLRRDSKKLLPLLAIVLIAIVAGEHFLLTPGIIELGRRVDTLPSGDSQVGMFWALHGAYSGLDLLKLALGFVVAARLAGAPLSRTGAEGKA